MSVFQIYKVTMADLAAATWPQCKPAEKLLTNAAGGDYDIDVYYNF